MSSVEFARMQQHGADAADWTSVNPVLLDRELGVEKDTSKIKIGDGATAWNDLPYAADGGGSGLPDGGTTGKPLRKNSDTDGDADWGTITLAEISDAGSAASSDASDFEPADPDLATIAGIDSSTAGAIASDGAGWIKKTYAQLKTALGLVKADIGLSNVDNTSDVNKPISTATQTALDLKASLASPTFTGHVAVPTPTSTTDAARKDYVDGLIAASDAVVYKGVIDCSANPNYPAADAGWLYRISVAGKIGGASGVNVEVGDTILCLADGTASGNQAAVGAFWNVIQANVDGAVVGPASSTDAHFAQFSGTTGKIVADDGLALDTDGTLAANSDTRLPSQKATKTAIAAEASRATTAEGTNAAAITTEASARATADALRILDPGGSNDDILQRKAGAWTNRTMVQLAADLGIPASLQVLLGSIDIPRRSLDLFRGAPNGVDTVLNGAITSTATTIVVRNQNLCSNTTEYPVIGIDAEQMLVLRGQGTATLTVIRHVNGTAAAAHSDGAPVVRDKVRNVPCTGDSTCQGTTTSVTGEWDAYVERTRRIFNERFGGSLGHGFYGLWRNPHASIPQTEFDQVGGTAFAVNSATSAQFCGPWANNSAATAATTWIWTRPAKVRVAQIDLWHVVWSSTQAETGTAWSYSIDGGATWINNPQASVDVHPTNTTTLGSADNGRRCDYWDGTKTMTLASVTGIENNAGFLFVDVGSGSTFKCRALFTYDGVSGSTLTNVKYVGPAAYNALTTVTGDVVQKRPELRKTSIVINDPTDFRFRAGTAAGTDKSCVFAGVDIWSSVPTFGVTKGVKVHNLGYSGNTLATFIGSRMINDIGTTNGSPTMTSAARGAFASTDVGSQVINANVPAGTIITAVASATSCTLSANATGSTITAGSVSNPTTIQGMRGSWDMVFNGAPASLNPSLVIESCWTNDMSAPVSTQGGDQTMTATFVSGSPNVTINAGNGIQPLDVGALFMDAAHTVLPDGTTVITRTDATHIVLSANAGSSVGPVAVNVGAPSAAIAQAISNRLGVLHGGGIAGNGVSAFASELLVVPFEQGATRLSGISSTAAYQAAYRQAMHDWATANRVATLDIYKAWADEGNTGYAAANADGLMDTGDTSGFHEGPVGYRDMASRITRLLEFA